MFDSLRRKLKKQFMSKIAKALELIKQGMNPHAAAQAAELAPNAVYRELKKQRAQITCPCCDSRVEKLLVPEPMVEALWEMRGKR
jgi:chaperonin GroEL (HSP60 family)